MQLHRVHVQRALWACRKAAAVDAALSALRAKGLSVSGCTCHVGSTEQRKAMIARAVQVRPAETHMHAST